MTELPPPQVEPVVVPRWIQLVALPLGLLALWSLARAAGPVLLIFIVASVIALILNPLVKLIERGRMPHAYLFSGPVGAPLVDTALALAGALNCHAKPGEGCGACVSCEKIAGGIHPDVVTLVREGAGQIVPIENVRNQVIARLGLPPHEADVRAWLRHALVPPDDIDDLIQEAYCKLAGLQAVDHIDLLLQGLQRLQGLAELHLGAIAFGAPVILVDAAAQEDHAEALGEGGGGRLIRQGVHRLQPGQRHAAAGALQHHAAGESAGTERGKTVLIALLGHINAPSGNRF